MSGMVLNQYILWKVKGKEPCVMKLTPANERRSRITTLSLKYGSGSKPGAFSWVIPKPSPKTTSNKKPTPSPNPTNNSESTTLSSSWKETTAFCPPSDAIFHKTLNLITSMHNIRNRHRLSPPFCSSGSTARNYAFIPSLLDSCHSTSFHFVGSVEDRCYFDLDTEMSFACSSQMNYC